MSQKKSRPNHLVTFLAVLLLSPAAQAEAETPAPIQCPEATPTPTPSPTPNPLQVRTEEEKKEIRKLWNTAIDAFQARNFTEAIPVFEKLLAQYPAEATLQDVRSYLAQAYFSVKKYAEAIPTFQSALETKGKNDEGNELRLLLGQSYIELKKFTEAFLVSEELMSQPKLYSTYRAKALLLRAKAQIGLKKRTDAEKSLASFQAVSDRDPELENEISKAALIRLDLKKDQCDSYPTQTELSDEIFMDEISKKSICILEMIALGVKAAPKLTPLEFQELFQQLEGSFQSFLHTIQHPSLRVSRLKQKEAQTAIAEMQTQLKDEWNSLKKLSMNALQDKEGFEPFLKKLNELSPSSETAQKK